MVAVRENMWLIGVLLIGLTVLAACFLVAAWVDFQTWWRIG